MTRPYRLLSLPQFLGGAHVFRAHLVSIIRNRARVLAAGITSRPSAGAVLSPLPSYLLSLFPLFSPPPVSCDAGEHAYALPSPRSGGRSEQALLWAGMFVVLASAVGVVSFVQISSYLVMGNRLTTRLQKMAFRGAARLRLSGRVEGAGCRTPLGGFREKRLHFSGRDFATDGCHWQRRAFSALFFFTWDLFLGIVSLPFFFSCCCDQILDAFLS